MRLLLIIALLSATGLLFAQGSEFKFGPVSYNDLQMKSYSKDTLANAVVLDEFGNTYFENGGDYNMIHEYHVRIKILKTDGLEKGNFVIPLYTEAHDKWLSLEASTFNIEGNKIQESKLAKSGFFLEKSNKYYDLVKFTLPNVRVGSVIEVNYRVSSEFIRNLKQWEFQDDIPKIKSEYWIKVPGNYIYNISLSGYLKLSKNESTIERDCFQISSTRKADCVFSKYGMADIPAFIEEDYMTAKKNFLSSVNFELSEVKHFDGTVRRLTGTWKDVDDELRSHENFGKQIRKASGLKDDKLKLLVDAEADPLKKATVIYTYVKDWYSWNGNYSKYSETDTKKAFEQRHGNVGDINLTLVGFLQEYGLDADPVMLSTRSNGLATELYPVLTQFNYVVARVKVGEISYLLDATDPFLPFGTLPERCINGKGRLISKTESSWIELKQLDKKRKFITMNLKLMDDGSLKGNLTIQSSGYNALAVRKEIQSKGDEKQYLQFLEKGLNAALSDYTIENKDDLSKSVIEKMNVEMTGFDNPDVPILYFSPFINGRYASNPLKSPDRLYPVDMGVAEETTIILTLELPDSIVVDEKPKNYAIQLPNNGGRFLLNASEIGNKITMTTVTAFNKPIYSSAEYPALREFFSRIVQAQQSQFVFKRKL